MTPSTLNVALVNSTSSSTVYAYITGLHNGAFWLLQSDGKTGYVPTSPAQNQSALQANCAIRLGAPGSKTTVTIPQLAGARLWFSVGKTLTFLLNQGPALVEPSVTNPADPNYNITWGFCEFTFNSSQMFANISYVDFVSLPISMTLTNSSGGSQHVAGMASNGLDTVCNLLKQQDATDNAGWSKLIVQSNGSNLRALSPNSGIVMNSGLFNGYYQQYVNAVFAKYATEPLSVNTQAQWATVSGTVSNNILNIDGVTFSKPSAADIFSCSTGPFAEDGNALRAALIPRLAAGFNRTTILIDSSIPDTPPTSGYYAFSPTNHYSRIVHSVNLDHRGYAFPYDDVNPTGGGDVAGTVSDPNPVLFTVAVGGVGASTTTSTKVAAAPGSGREKAIHVQP